MARQDPIQLNAHGSFEGEPSHRASVRLLNDLALTIERDIAELCDVAELPRRSASRFDLDRDMSAGLVGRDDVVMRDVAGERGREQLMTLGGGGLLVGTDRNLTAFMLLLCDYFVLNTNLNGVAEFPAAS